MTGNAGRRPINNDEPELGAGEPVKPDWLDEHASAEWDRLVAILVPARVLTKGEGGILLMACDAFSRWMRCTKFLQEQKSEHYIVKSDGGDIHKQFVEVGQRNVAWRNYLSALAELGLTPSSRTRIKALPNTERTGIEQFFTS